jgi:hypothetical protein
VLEDQHEDAERRPDRQQFMRIALSGNRTDRNVKSSSR